MDYGRTSDNDSAKTKADIGDIQLYQGYQIKSPYRLSFVRVKVVSVPPSSPAPYPPVLLDYECNSRHELIMITNTITLFEN